MKVRKFVPIFVGVLLLGSTFFVGVFVGKNTTPEIEKVNTLSNKELGKPDVVDFAPFWETWNVINDRFVDVEPKEDISTQDKVWGAISGLTESLDDPYSVFLPPSESELFAEDISGNFSGVGMEIGIQDDVITVVAPLRNTPADRANIESGDKIIAIDGQSTADMAIDEAVAIIRGETGTVVTLTLLRSEEPFEVTLTRERIQIPVLRTELREDGIFVIELYSFTATAPARFRSALREFLRTGSQDLLIDLRGNPGGFLVAATDIASWFLEPGKVIVREASRNGGGDRVHRSKGYNVINDSVEVVVLVNGGSASASEIVAGALQEQGVATLVGTQTFGKGSVQELISITDDTSLKLTVAQWLTPGGTSISAGGLTPDIVVEFTEEDIEGGSDPQLNRAVEVLLDD